MNYEQLNAFVKNLKISKDQILREEAEMIFLNELANHRLGSRVIFYGGTALRLVYGSPRFSEDIDLLMIKKITYQEFIKFIDQVVKNNFSWKLKDKKNKRNTIFALISITDQKIKHSFSLKIEIHKPAVKIKLETGLSLIKSPINATEPLLLVPSLKELKKLKLNALLGRKKARDVFDLWYIDQNLKENFILPEKMPAYSQTQFKNVLQVFLPPKYFPIIKQLYEQINRKNKRDS